MTPLPNGIDVESGELRLRILALRDDVLRVTYARCSSLPEDASWAVLPSARQGTVPVSIDTNSGRLGFHTHTLTVEVDKKTLELSVLDLAGNVLRQDARPIQFDGDAFRIYKSMPLDEHYFGLTEVVSEAPRCYTDCEERELL